MSRGGKGGRGVNSVQCTLKSLRYFHLLVYLIRSYSDWHSSVCNPRIVQVDSMYWISDRDTWACLRFFRQSVLVSGDRLFSGHVFKQSGKGARQSECDHSPPLVSVSANPQLFVQQTGSSWDTSWSREWTHRYLAPQGTGPVVQATSTISRATEKSSGPCCARGLTWQQECPARVQDQLLESYVHSSCTLVVQIQE